MGLHLKLPEAALRTGQSEIAEGAILERLPASHYQHVKEIDLTGNDTFDVPSAVWSMGSVALFQSGTIYLSKHKPYSRPAVPKG